jgi:hypothetical protein
LESKTWDLPTTDGFGFQSLIYQITHLLNLWKLLIYEITQLPDPDN